MIKLLQKISLAVAFISANALAQEGTKLPLPATFKKSTQSHNASKSSFQQIASTTCGTDTILYPYLKELAFNAPNDSFFVDAMVGNVRTASQAYLNNSPVTIKGIQFWGGAYSTGSSPQTLQIKLILYAVNAVYQPTLAIDSSVITITNNYDFYEGVFLNPQTVNGNFAVAVKNVPNDTVAVITNNAGNNWSVPAYGEGLAWRKFGSGTWNSSLSFFGQGLEYMIFPIVTQTVSSAFTVSQSTVCPNTTVSFTNVSSGTVNNRFFNLNTFDDYWNLAPADSSFKWNYGGAQWFAATNGVNTFTAAGTHTVSLASELAGYYSTCLDTSSATVFVKPSYSQSLTATICAGDFYTLGSQSYSVAGIYTQTLTSSYTCDSIVTVNLNTNTVNVGVTSNGATLVANANGGTYQWINCAISNSWIPGATSQTFAPAANGSYAVIVTQNNCSDTSACVVVTTVGLKGNYGLNLNARIHPNPAKSTVVVDCGFIADKIIVRDLLGRERLMIVPENGQTIIDLTELPSSVYLVTIFAGSDMQTLKVIKN